MCTLIRPTGFVDSPFGHDGKVARLAGGLNWFANVELIHEDGRRELIPVESLEGLLDEAMAADWARITSPRAPLQLGERTIRLDQPQVMAIVNATPDSFSDGGSYADASAAADAGAVMASQGAAIIDVGGESTRPGASDVWEGDEIERVVPVVRQLAAGGAAVSIDTRKSAVMTAAIAAGTPRTRPSLDRAPASSRGARCTRDVPGILRDTRGRSHGPRRSEDRCSPG